MPPLTLHLVPEATWAATDLHEPYAPASLATEGFVHCTNGEDELLATGDRYYASEPGSWLVLTVDLGLVGAPWTVDDPDRRYPHVHGPIERAAIVAVRAVRRGPDGRFVGIGPAHPLHAGGGQGGTAPSTG